MRLADFVIEFLKKKGIDTVFTVSGGGSIFLCDALYKAKKMLPVKYMQHYKVEIIKKTIILLRNQRLQLPHRMF